MRQLKEFGVAFENRDTAEWIACARLAEQLGYGSVWITEDYFCRGAFSLAAAVACNTTSLRIGIGVLSTYTRHPALIAMECGALEDLSGGRLVLGMGAGVKYWIKDQLHLSYRKPRVALRESVEIIRRMIRGEQLSYEGQLFQTSDVHLNFKPPRPEIPIHLGVTSPKNLELAGEVGDGVILGFMSSAPYTRHAMEQVRIGAARAGRSLDDFAVTNYLTISVSEDEKAARETVKPFLAFCLSLMSDYAEQPVFMSSGLDPEEIRRFGQVFAEDGKPPAHLVTGQIIDILAIAGSPEHCRERLQEFIDAGVTSATAFEIPGISGERTIREVHKHLMSHFR